MKILIAEDDLTSRTILAAVTRKWGFDPTVAEDGEAAWLEFQKPDSANLLLIDWEMPLLDGVGLCKRIREQVTNNPPFIILLTARRETDDVVKGLDAGANDYIAKPFANAELQARLQVGMRMLELQAELKQTQDELIYEKTVIENIILKMRFSKPFDSTHLRSLEIPVEKTSGDVLLSTRGPDNTRYILLGDYTGHGLMAAVGGPLVYDVFYTMAGKGLPVKLIANEINQQLLEKMPIDLFFGAIFIKLSPEGNVSLWNCGMSEILIYRNAKPLKKIPSNMLALGIVKQDFDPVYSFQSEAGDRIYAYSDGITEVINVENEEFGQDRLEQSITELLGNDDEIGFLKSRLDEFRGDAKLFDDVTLMELKC